MVVEELYIFWLLDYLKFKLPFFFIMCVSTHVPWHLSRLLVGSVLSFHPVDLFIELRLSDVMAGVFTH